MLFRELLPARHLVRNFAYGVCYVYVTHEHRYDKSCAEIMRRYRLATKRDAVNLALRTLANEPLRLDEARHLRGFGWTGDLEEMRTNRQA